MHRHNADRCGPLVLTGGRFALNRWSAVLVPGHTVFVAAGDWFTVGPGVQYRGGLLLVPLVCRTALEGVELSASGPHVLSVGDRAAVFGPVAELGDLSPGKKCFVAVRTDGALGPLVVTVDVRAAGGASRRLVVDVPAHGTPRVVEQPAE